MEHSRAPFSTLEVEDCLPDSGCAAAWSPCSVSLPPPFFPPCPGAQGGSSLTVPARQTCMSEPCPQRAPLPVCAFSPGTMGQLVACGPVEKQGRCWLAQGRQVLAPSLILSRTAHTQRLSLVSQSSGATTHPDLLSGLAARGVGSPTAHPQFKATLNKEGKKPQPPPCIHSLQRPGLLPLPAEEGDGIEGSPPPPWTQDNSRVPGS